MGFKYKVDKNFFKTWTPIMAYILGLIYADGSLEDASYLRGKYLRLTSTDKELISITKSSMRSEHTIVVIKPKLPNHKLKYFLRIGSHAIYYDLEKLGLFPNKSLTMKFPKVPKKYLAHFIRGYFDGDGHVGIAKNKGDFKRLIIVFVSGSSDFLNSLSGLMSKELCIKKIKVHRGWRAYRLAYSTRDSIKLFNYMYKSANNTFLTRKFRVFKKFFIEYNKWVDKDIQKILNHGAMVK